MIERLQNRRPDGPFGADGGGGRRAGRVGRSVLDTRRFLSAAISTHWTGQTGQPKQAGEIDGVAELGQAAQLIAAH